LVFDFFWKGFHFWTIALSLKIKTKKMPENFFDNSTAAVGTIFTIIALAILATIIIWG